MYIIKILLYIFLNNKILSKFSKITNNNFSYMTLIHIILIKSKLTVLILLIHILKHIHINSINNEVFSRII
ncbi:hypothetical protein PFTANZ_03950 [Plasmodium falciparum Tanzania (2000708)]|uniref:Uncharacterized protein n=1 Tax=Plasmodium falciparum Tanzania (2000708) TaxID=1036725 RepID=A0A024W5C9_PLAFA|nr:hypothetical protein PFTANZ_03950 [Plasmodium falciparum Tanzania (2000708)]